MGPFSLPNRKHLMTVKCHSEAEKDQIVAFFNTRKYSLKEIALAYGTSARTVNRILVERGLATTVPRLKGDAHQVMAFLRTMDITTLDALKDHLKAKTVSPETVQEYLNDCSSEQLNAHFYQAVKAAIFRTPTNVPRSTHPALQGNSDLFAVAA